MGQKTYWIIGPLAQQNEFKTKTPGRKTPGVVFNKGL